jgi:hypothetical protein
MHLSADVVATTAPTDIDEALANYRRALQLNPKLWTARRDLTALLIRMGRRDEATALCREEMLAGFEDSGWLEGLLSSAMEASDLRLAGEYAAILAALQLGSQWYPPRRDGFLPSLPVRPPAVQLTIPKLRHDIEQFIYLQNQGVLGAEFTPVIRYYERVIDRLMPLGLEARMPLNAEEQRSIGHVYNRIVHVRQTPRVRRALSDAWDPAAVEAQYVDRPPGVAVVDDFLSRDALESLRLFCLESTVWSTNRYAHGRLGAFFRDGFNCPMLLQIAEELRQALPNVIGRQYPLRQMWGFKYGSTLPADSTNHADFAAVNVNFWITPAEANMDETCGGLVIYDVGAPLSWDFDTYNRRRDVITPFLQRQGARSTTISYRQNRAVIFNSDLFHATAEVRFRPGYENRRINITLLYGERENDVHYRPQAQQDSMGGPDIRQSAWRSAAFARARGLRRVQC